MNQRPVPSGSPADAADQTNAANPGDQGAEAQPAPDASNTQKDPEDWVTKDEPMTGAQASYLQTLSQEADEPFDESLTKAEASRRIEDLQAKTGRGQSS
jgi:hypothetical protein